MGRKRTSITRSAPMSTPVSLPPQRQTFLDHRAAQIEPVRLDAPGGRPGAASGADGGAFHWFAADKYMAFTAAVDRAADQFYEAIARRSGRGSRTGLVRAAGAIGFTRRNAGEADPWTLGTPNRPVAIPHPGRRAGEGRAGGDDLEGGEDHVELLLRASERARERCIAAE